MSWTNGAKKTKALRQQDPTQKQFGVRITFGDDTLYELRHGKDATEVADHFQRDLELAQTENGGWWDWRGDGGTLRRIRVAFIAGFEVRPAGGSGSWSG